jgi:hypothetical protein
MDWINWTENADSLYCIPITSYWKPHTVWPFPVQHQSDDRYTKCTEHLYTPSVGTAACAYATVVCQIYTVYVVTDDLGSNPDHRRAWWWDRQKSRWKNEVLFRNAVAVLWLCLLCGGTRFDLAKGYSDITTVTTWEQCSFSACIIYTAGYAWLE